MLIRGPEKFVPKLYQERAIRDVLNDRFRALFLDPGLGKTAITLSAIQELIDCCDIRSALVVAPLRVCYKTWPDEAAKWAQFNRLRVHNLHDTSVRVGDFNCVSVARRADIYLINPEGLPRLFGRPIDVTAEKSGKVRREWWNGPWKGWADRPDMLVVDESTAFKNHDSRRFGTLKRFLSDFGRRVILTGTPSPNGGQDLFAQMQIVDQGVALGTEIGKFRARFMTRITDSDYGSRYKMTEGAMERVQTLIQPRVTALRAEDWLQMPEKIVTDIPVRLPEKARDLYRRAKEQAFAQLESGEHFFATGGALMKLRQIANGRVYIGEKPNQTVAAIHEEKGDALEELSNELGRPMLVAFEFRCDGEYLAKRFGWPMIIGGQKPEETSKLIAAWNRKELPGLIVQCSTVAHGLNMQAGGDVVVWYSLPWSCEVYIQLNARLHRQGQTSPSVMIYHLITEGTADVRVAEVLETKGAEQEDLFNALKLEVLSLAI